LLRQLVTRIYFPDEVEANAADPILASVGDAARARP
jgi:protocatechuate 3,4-dioxygenase beta subunit